MCGRVTKASIGRDLTRLGHAWAMILGARATDTHKDHAPVSQDHAGPDNAFNLLLAGVEFNTSSSNDHDCTCFSLLSSHTHIRLYR